MTAWTDRYDVALEKLEAHVPRITEPRKLMLVVLARQSKPLTAEELHEKLSGVNLVTVYRTLTAFEQFGLVRRSDFGDGFHRYELIDEESHHHHVVCRICRKVERVNFCGAETLERMVRQMGYKNVGHTLEIFGACAKCSK